MTLDVLQNRVDIELKILRRCCRKYIYENRVYLNDIAFKV